MVGEQLAQGSQPLNLGRFVHPIPSLRARRDHKADAFEIAQHACGPTGSGRGLMHGERLGWHDTTNVTTCMLMLQPSSLEAVIPHESGYSRATIVGSC